MTPQSIMATEAFLTSMRRSWVALGGQGDCPVRGLASYPAAQRMALINAIDVAIRTVAAPAAQ